MKILSLRLISPLKSFCVRKRHTEKHFPGLPSAQGPIIHILNVVLVDANVPRTCIGYYFAIYKQIRLGQEIKVLESE